ncbi:MAG: ABC transporter permease [Thermoanaerobaculaceae bacterium]|jgi:putative ABC transport system permease protein|nr:ABC transporter permease [Thermoanaerobaculaceae bacterium]
MDTLWHDLRLALRSLLRTPGFTAMVLATLALGIGATTGVFSALHTVLLASMPYPEPDRLVFGVSTFKERPTGLSAHDYFDYRDQATSFESLGANLQYVDTVPSSGGDRPETLNTTHVSTNLFRTLGVAPLLGREFTAEEGKPAPIPDPNQNQLLPPVAIISHALWQKRFGGSPSAVGSALTLQGQPITVVGVMPQGFRFFVDTDVWLPMRLNGWHATERRFHNWVVVGRLKPGVTLDQGRAEMSAIARRLEATYPDSNKDMGLRLTNLHEALVARLRPQVLLAMAAVALMLLIACGNVANLLLARGVTRRSDMAMRLALGASRGRLVRTLLTESLTLALLGGTLGLGVAVALQRLLPSLLRMDVSRLGIASLHLDVGVLLFAFGVSLATGVGVGLVPALRSTRISLFAEVKGGSRTVTSRGGARLRMALVASQVSVSVVLLVGSALLIRSFAKLVRVDLGFDPERVVTAELSLPASMSNEASIQFFAGVLDEVRATPGVTAAGMVSRLPVLHGGGSTEVWAPERPSERSFSQQALGRVVLPGYFAAMRMPLVAGRDVQETDRPDTPVVTVISQETARTIFGDQSPIGRQVATDFGGDQPTLLEVVGVVADARLNDLDDGPSMVMYLSYHQLQVPGMHVAIRTAGDSGAITRALREIVWRRDRGIPVDGLTTLQGEIRRSTLPQQTLTGAVTSFSLLALLLAAIGLFGVLAYQVNQRRNEIGIRMALGARQGHVLATILRQGLVVTGVGLVAGVVAGLALTRLMAGMLYEVAATDPTSFVGAVACLVVVALAACLVPALRALAVQPVQALRYE